uniref:Zinc transporter ZIP13 homolog n=1 Tax=Cacopsylla melanoneura TaxID=428564 RepID=A0A8D8WCX1_9HEMI
MASMFDLNSLENSTSNLNYFFNNIMTSDMNPLNKMEYEPWIFAVIGSLLIGLSGVFPILIIPIDDLEHMNSKKESSTTLKLLLSFAVGGLLGDVFLHLLPEAWTYEHSHSGANGSGPCMTCGLWVLAGLLVFVVAEKAFNVEMAETAPEEEEEKKKKKKRRRWNRLTKRGTIRY